MTGRPLLVIGHVPKPSIEVVAKAAEALKVPIHVVRPFLGEDLPSLDDFRGIVILGGPQSAYDDELHPFLAREKAYVAAAYGAGVPTLAVCLGSQLAADALGGKSRAGDHGLEVGFIEIRATTKAGEPLAGRYFSFHTDTADPPPRAEVLATSDHYPQAWRLGPLLAIQFHPDLDRQGIEQVLAVEQEKLAAAGNDVAALRSEVAAADYDAGRGLLTDWIESLTDESGPPAPDEPPDQRAHRGP